MDEKGIRNLTWTVQPGKAVTVEQFLRAKGCSHHVLMHLKRTDGGIIRNGEPVFTNRLVYAGDTISIRIIETSEPGSIQAVSLPLDIIYEDEDLLVVDKPHDMPVHPSMGNYENTLANAVMYYFSSRDIPFVFRCVTRLDRDTTGLVLIAKNMLSSAILSDMSAHRQIHREYLAITEGVLPESGTIEAPIARAEGSPLLRCVDFESGERAVTHFQRLGIFGKGRKTSVPEASCDARQGKKSPPGCHLPSLRNSWNRADASDPCPYEVHRTSAARRFPLQPGFCLLSRAETDASLPPSLLRSSDHRRVSILRKQTAAGYAAAAGSI